MANKRHRNGRWYYRVKHRLLERPLYVSFEDEQRGDDYIRQLESMLAVGVVPKAVKAKVSRVDQQTVVGAISAYSAAVTLPESDRLLLDTLSRKLAGVALPLDYPWVERWVTSMQTERLSPSTIRHYAGALSRCLDWLVRSRPQHQESNPLKMLPKRYASYRDGAVRDVERDRRLTSGEEAAIRKVLGGWVPPDRERGVAVDPDLTLLFDLALETAMRLREMFTLAPDQIDLGQRTVFLDRTKNGDSRQVPLSTVAVARLQGFKGFPWLRSGDAADLRRVTSLLSRRFGTVFELAGCGDFRLHDARHEATCRLYERTTLSDVQIARITGHKDLRMLRRYASLRGSDLAARLW
jgi:integrase